MSRSRVVRSGKGSGTLWQWEIGKGDMDRLGSEWTGVDGSTVGDAWEALSVD